MPGIATFFYLVLIIIYLAMGAAIVFHMLYYKINRHVALVMFLIYVIGAVLLLVSNFIIFRSVNWYMLISNAGF
jgi:hypothetical protein